MPDLATLPTGSRVFVDTNIFDLHYQAKSVSCSVFIDRVARDEVTAYVNIQVLSDLMHKLMLAEACAKRYIKDRAAPKLKECLQKDRAKAATLVDYQKQFEDTMAIGLRVLPINKKLFIATKVERATYGLLTGDSLHLGTMTYHSIPLRDIVTNDSDFSHIAGLTVWKPKDVVP